MNLRKLFIVTALFFGTSGYVNASNNAFANASAEDVIETNYNTPGILFANAILASYGIEGYNGEINSIFEIDLSREDLRLDITQSLYPWEYVDEEPMRLFKSLLDRYIDGEHDIWTLIDVIVKRNVRSNGFKFIKHIGCLYEVVHGSCGMNVLMEHKNLKSIELLIVDSSFSIFFGMISPNCLLFNLVITQDSSKYLLKNNIILDTGKIVLR